MDLTWLRALLDLLLHRIWRKVDQFGHVRSANQPSGQQQGLGTFKRSDGAICSDIFANQLSCRFRSLDEGKSEPGSVSSRFRHSSPKLN